MFQQFKKKADYLAAKIQESQQINKVIGESQSYDQQLLEGLPMDDFGGKLF